MFQAQRDFSQYGEQPIILNYFQNCRQTYRPYCVDVGAFDGVVGSNSRALFLNGWSGAVVEPNPRTFSRLHTLYASRSDVACLQLAVSDREAIDVPMQFAVGPAGTEEADRWQYGQVSTLNDFFADYYKNNYKFIYEERTVTLTRLLTILRDVAAPPDFGFLSIDCEAEDVKILKDMDFSLYRPQLLCVECDDASRRLMGEILESQGYSYHAHTVANTLFEKT